MTGREREARRLRTLAARLRDDWHVAEQVDERLTRAVERVRTDGADDVTVGAAALYLQNFYSAVEDFLHRVVLELDGSIPSGSDWHRELIDQVGIEIKEVRPALLDEQLSADLDHLQRFRHLVRNGYAQSYDWDEMQAALTARQRVIKQFPNAFARFERFLEQTIETLERGEE